MIGQIQNSELAAEKNGQPSFGCGNLDRSSAPLRLVVGFYMMTIIKCFFSQPREIRVCVYGMAISAIALLGFIYLALN